jgi:hypothetical protein
VHARWVAKTRLPVLRVGQALHASICGHVRGPKPITWATVTCLRWLRLVSAGCSSSCWCCGATKLRRSISSGATVHGVGSWRAGRRRHSSLRDCACGAGCHCNSGSITNSWCSGATQLRRCLTHSLQAEEKGEECERAGPLKAMAWTTQCPGSCPKVACRIGAAAGSCPSEHACLAQA